MSSTSAWNQLASHFDLHDESVSRLDFASAANRFIAWPAILALAGSRDARSRKALDFGCGTGGLCHKLLDSGFRVIGVDQSSAMVEVAQAKTHSDIEYQVGTHDLFSKLQPVDVLTCSLVLNYFPCLEAFVVDAEGLLSSGGLLVTADLSRPYVSACLRAGIIYEDFDSLEEPREGVLNFGDGVRVPLTIRTERDYDRLLLPRGWQKSGVLYPPWPSEYLSVFSHQFPLGYPVTVPKYQVLSYRWPG